jgi:hypothetical protein
MRSAFKNELKFPGNIFKYCTGNNLNLSHLLEDSVMTPIKLVNINDGYDCFKNCHLGDINSMFKNCFKSINKKEINDNDKYSKNLYKIDRGGLHGIIPYNFFLNRGKITNMSNIFENCCHLGTNIDLVCDNNGDYVDGNGDFIARDEKCFYNVRKPDLQTIIDVSNGIKDISNLLDLVENKNDKWEWNAWSYDGTIFEEEYINALNSIKIDGKTYIEAKRENIPNYIDLEWTHKDSSNNIIEPTNNIVDNLEHCNLNKNQKE